MMNAKRHIKKFFLFGFGMMLAGCSEDVDPGFSPNGQEGDADVTLTINVSVANSGSVTRADEFTFDPTTNPYELINTLRIIIVREDNTVEWNRLVSAPASNVGLNKMGELQFKVSTDKGTTDLEEDTRTEKKRIYLIANEASIPANPNGGVNVVSYLSSLKPGYYRKVPQIDQDSEDFKNLPADEQWAIKWNRELYVPGDQLTPQAAAGLIIYNDWPNGTNGAAPDFAVPYINNQGATKNFVPMTEFFDIEVTENLKTGLNVKDQVENLFITRNLVKFRFHIDATPGTTPFKITGITFDKLMQEEYLFPNGAVYSPAKDDPATDNKREIISFNTPGIQNKNICPYVFHPTNFGYNGDGQSGYVTLGCEETYSPALYFCETKTNKLTAEGKPEFRVGIDVEFPSTEEVKGENGNAVIKPITSHYDAKFPLDNQPNFIPRNSIVDVFMTMTNGVLNAKVTVLPYIAVDLNPEFGFSRPESDRLTVATNMNLQMGVKGLLYATYTPAPENPETFMLIWVSNNTDVLKLESQDNPESSLDQRYVEPSESIELPYVKAGESVPADGRSLPVRLVPIAPGEAEVAVYSNTGLVARCKVTVR